MSTYLHSGDLGDIIYALPIIKHLGGGTLYLTSRPGTREPMTPARFEFLRPLLASQPYIKSVEMHKGQKITHDFTGFREGRVRDVTLAELQRRHVQPLGVRPNFRLPWLAAQAAGGPTSYIVVARSARYQNPEWDSVWPTILRMEHKPLFVGTKEEHAAFELDFGEVQYQPLASAKELAELIEGSEVFVGNQSLPYAIAEGLKHKRILEVAPRPLEAGDCIFPDQNATHVAKAKEWPEVAQAKLLLALQLCPDDQSAALDLAQLIEKIEDDFRPDVEVAICLRDDVGEDVAEALVNALSPKFKVHVLRSRRNGRGWPDGCNDLWQASIVEIGKLARERQIRAEAVLTFEPDCIPARKDWLAALASEWRTVRRKGKIAFGAVHDAGGTDGLHMNGNMVVEVGIAKRHPEVQTSSDSWDMAHRKLFLSIGQNSNLIVNLYAERRELTVEQVADIRKGGTRPALIHGIKNDSGRRAIETLLKEGKL